MIEFKVVKQCVTSDGQAFNTIAEAQTHQIELMIPGIGTDVVQQLIENAEQLIDVLSIKRNSHPRARKLHGATRAKKAKPTSATPTPPNA